VGFTDEDVQEGRALVVRGGVNRLDLGDKLLAVTAACGESVLDRFCEEIGLHGRTGRDYRNVARVCTPPLRARIEATGVMVAWSVLREGARPAAGGLPVDEGYRKLLALLEQASAEGRALVSLPQYHQVLGTAPALRDLLGSEGGDGSKLVAYLGGLRGAEREKIVTSLLEADTDLRKSVRRTIDDQRRRERDRERLDGGGKAPGPSLVMARDLVRIGDQVDSFIGRYQSAGQLAEAEVPAAQLTLVKAELLVTWLRVRVDGERAGARRTAKSARMPAGV